MTEEDLVLRASMKDELTRPLEKVTEAVDAAGNAAKDTAPKFRDQARATDEAGAAAQRTDGRLAKLAKNGGSKLVGMFKTGTKVVAGFVTGLAAVTAGKGISRLLGIEDAEAQLRGLGYTGRQITKVMDSALKSVKGTAFGLADAATVASTAVAAGVKPGRDLTKYLKSVADTATIAKAPLGEIGSIFNKVQTNGVAMTDDLQQLADRGIPIFTWLRDEYKVSGVELRKMVSSGKVDSETFRKVITKNIGGAALESGKTTRGAWANTMASLGRIGAGVLGGVFPQAKEGLNGLTKYLGPMEAKSKALGDRLSKVDIGGTLQGWGSKAIPVLRKIGGGVVGFVKSWGQVGPPLRKFARVYGPPVVKLFDKIYKAAEPVASFLLDNLAPAIANVLGFLADNKDAVLTFVAIAGGAQVLGLAILGLQKVLLIARTAFIAFNLVVAANPVSLIVLAIAALAAGLVFAYQRSETFRGIIDTTWAVLKYVGAWIKNVFVAYLVVLGVAWLTMAQVIVRSIRLWLGVVLGGFGIIVKAAAKAFGWIPGIGPKIKSAAKGFEDFTAGVDSALRAAEDKIVDTRGKLIEFGQTNIKVPKLDLDTSPAKTKLSAFRQALLDYSNQNSVGVLAPPKAKATGKPKEPAKAAGNPYVPGGDTATRHGWGGSGGSRLGRTLAAHSAVSGRLGGGYKVTNALMGGGGHGRGSGDHQAGRAVDVTGRNLPAYAREVRANGGYARIHGEGPRKHVHAVMGDTATSRRGSMAGGGGGISVVVQDGAIRIDGSTLTQAELTAAVQAALNQIIREAEETTA